MKKQKPNLYDVCECNHESMLHEKGVNSCITDIPIGKKLYRGWFPSNIPAEPCDCLKFKFSKLNTDNPKPTENF